MNKLLILSAMALLLPVIPALACFDSDGTLFRTSSTSEGAHGGRSFDREPISMYYCGLAESGFVVVNGKCYDRDAILDFDTEEECQADEVCKAYREQQEKERPCEEYHVACQDDAFPPEPEPSPPYKCNQEGIMICQPIEDPIDDPNHGEIKGDEELIEDEEEHQEEEEQGQAQGESEETAARLANS